MKQTQVNKANSFTVPAGASQSNKFPRAPIQDAIELHITARKFRCSATMRPRHVLHCCALKFAWSTPRDAYLEKRKVAGARFNKSRLAADSLTLSVTAYKRNPGKRLAERDKKIKINTYVREKRKT